MENKAYSQGSKKVVNIEVFKNRLRLRWNYVGRRYCLALGLENTELNYKAAQQKALQIELDIISGNFDPTLTKYKPPVPELPQTKDIKVEDLCSMYRAYKAKSLYDRSIEKYDTTFKHLNNQFPNKLVSSIKIHEAEKFSILLSSKMAPITLKERLVIIKACWDWGIKQGLVKDNPWIELPTRVKVPPKPLAKPFTKEEIKVILNVFENHKDYCFYLPFVKFRFLTGTRVSEATGLRWQDISDDLSEIWIGSTLTRGVRKPTKTNKARIFPCNNELKELLLSIKPLTHQPGDLVFPSPQGKAINDSLFGKRAWKTCITLSGIEYRSFYNVRHTFISHCLQSGMAPTVVAQLTGHDVQVLYENYAGSVLSRPQIPELFTDKPI